jgi:hypothetical protein
MSANERRTRAYARDLYPIQEHFRRQLRELGREDLLEDHADAVQRAQDRHAASTRDSDREIGPIEDRMTDALVEGEKRKLERAVPYPSRSAAPVSQPSSTPSSDFGDWWG